MKWMNTARPVAGVLMTGVMLLTMAGCPDDPEPTPLSDVTDTIGIDAADGAGGDVTPIDADSVEPDGDIDPAETTEPDATVPDTTGPDATVPDTTGPDATLPDTTGPDATVPDTTEPDATVPDTTEPDATVPDTTEPDATVPDTTEPDATVPDTTGDATAPDAATPATCESFCEALIGVCDGGPASAEDCGNFCATVSAIKCGAKMDLLIECGAGAATLCEDSAPFPEGCVDEMDAVLGCMDDGPPATVESICTGMCASMIASGCGESPIPLEACVDQCSVPLTVGCLNYAAAALECVQGVGWFCGLDGPQPPAACASAFDATEECFEDGPVLASDCATLCESMYASGCFSESTPGSLSECTVLCDEKAATGCTPQVKAMHECAAVEGWVCGEGFAMPALACETEGDALEACFDDGPPAAGCKSFCSTINKSSCTPGMTDFAACEADCAEGVVGPCGIVQSSLMACVDVNLPVCEEGTMNFGPCAGAFEALEICDGGGEFCDGWCSLAVAPGCAAFAPDFATCKLSCGFMSGGSCGAVMAAALDCADGADLTCSEAGIPTAAGCTDEFNAVFTCVPDGSE